MILSNKNSNGVTAIETLCFNLIDNYMDNSCTFAITCILVKLIKNKKEKCKTFVNIFLDQSFRDVLSKIIKNYFCNSIIMSNVITILYFLLEYMELNEVFKIVTFSKLKQIFCVFKLNGFDVIHEYIIYFIKSIFSKRNLSSIQPQDFNDLVFLFTNAFIFLRNKIFMLDFGKLGKWVFQLMTIMFNISNLLNNFDPSLGELISKACVEHKLIDWLTEIFYNLLDKQMISRIDNCFDTKLDLNLIATKTILLRTMFYCMTLIINVKEHVPNALVI